MATDTLASPATLSHTQAKVFKNFIDGEWVESSSGETFENRNPADTRDLVGIFQKSAKADVDAAVGAAKRARDTPLSTFNLVRAFTDAGIPKGVVNIVSGFGAEVGTPLAEHEDVRAVSLTGSSAVGRIIGGIAAKSFKHCSLELGGKNPMIVLDDANLDLAIEGGIWGRFVTTCQRCTATNRI